MTTSQFDANETGAALVATSVSHCTIAELFATWYAELRSLAQYVLRRRDGVRFSATALVHETFLAMVSLPDALFPDRARFFAYASRVMRSLVIDHARRSRCQKRGPQLEVSWEDDEPRSMIAAATSGDASRLGAALAELARQHTSLAQLVVLHSFGGMTFADIAHARRVSERTVQREWQRARVLLHHLLCDEHRAPRRGAARS